MEKTKPMQGTMIKLMHGDMEFLRTRSYNVSKLSRTLISNFIKKEKEKEELLYAVQTKPEYPKKEDVHVT